MDIKNKDLLKVKTVQTHTHNSIVYQYRSARCGKDLTFLINRWAQTS